MDDDPERITAPMQPFTFVEVRTGLAVALAGLLVTFGLPLALV